MYFRLMTIIKDGQHGIWIVEHESQPSEYLAYPEADSRKATILPHELELDPHLHKIKVLAQIPSSKRRLFFWTSILLEIVP